MKYRIVGADAATGKERISVIEAATENDALRLAKQQGLFTSEIAVLPPPALPNINSRRPTKALCEYMMVQVPPTILVQDRERGSEAASYLQGVVNRYAAEGWEFYRVDSIGVAVQPGCLGQLLGYGTGTIHYHVITFRRQLGDAS